MHWFIYAGLILFIYGSLMFAAMLGCWPELPPRKKKAPDGSR